MTTELSQKLSAQQHLGKQEIKNFIFSFLLRGAVLHIPTVFEELKKKICQGDSQGDPANVYIGEH